MPDGQVCSYFSNRGEAAMATNLVSLVMQFLTPELIGRIATALGLDRNNTQTAIGAVVPALLAAFSHTATQPGGAQRLVDAARQQTGTLGNFANMLGTGGQSLLLEKGSQMLSALLGGQEQNSLGQAVAKFAGLSQGPAGSLLGMLAPVVLGTIGQQRQQGRSLDAGGITDLLASQKDNIAAALPSGFSTLLGGTGLLDALGGAARTATAAGSEAARGAASTARVVGDTGRHAADAATSASRNWLYWLIPIAAVAALLIYLFARPAEQVAQQKVTTAQSLMVGGLDVGKQVTDSITSLRTTLSSVTDTASAQAALPQLRDVTAQIDKVDGLIGQLSPEQRKTLAGVVNPVMSTLNGLFDKVLAIPGVADVLKPTIDLLKDRLAALTV
jgi:Bacterial protein of unknown function (DUF937)